jgi:cytochrome c
MGIAGAPKIGDTAQWTPRLAKGKDVLYRNSIQGFLGETGMMPPKGGRMDLPEEMVRAAVDYMVERVE